MKIIALTTSLLFCGSVSFCDEIDTITNKLKGRKISYSSTSSKIGSYKLCNKEEITIQKTDTKKNKEEDQHTSESEMRFHVERSARANGVSEKTIKAIIPNLKYTPGTEKKRANTPIVTQDFQSVYDRFAVNEKVKTAKVYASLYDKQFNDIFEIFGVNRSILLAIWGMETKFGAIKGNTKILNSLFSLAITNKSMGNYFRINLVTLIKLIDLGYFDAEVKGAFDGGVGHCQFMPDSIYKYAISINSSKPDIINNPIDGLASIANYLYNNGWDSSGSVLTEVEVPVDFNLCYVGLSTKKTIQEWENLGIKSDENKIGYDHLTDKELEASLIIPDINNDQIPTEKQRAFLIYDNFRVLLSWNKALKYVTTLAITKELTDKAIMKR